MHVTIYHNPRCSKSREALALLEAKGIKPIVREYLQDVPSLDELKALLRSLKLPAHDMLRTKEDEYKMVDLSKTSSDDAIMQALHDYPKLLERPVVVCGEKAVIARPAEKLLDIIT